MWGRHVDEPLSDLMAEMPEDRDLPLGELIDALGARAHGTALLLLSLPDSVPLPIPSIGAILGVPLALVSLHLAVFGGAGRLPRRVQRWRFPARGIGALKRYAIPFLTRTERISRPRLGLVAERQRAIGVVCLVLSLILLLPIPFMNALPSICLALLAWGIVQRDGAFVLAGLATSAALLVTLGFLADQLVGLVDEVV